MFVEYNMATSERFSEYFGFSNEEVDGFYAVYVRTVDTYLRARQLLQIYTNMRRLLCS